MKAGLGYCNKFRDNGFSWEGRGRKGAASLTSFGVLAAHKQTGGGVITVGGAPLELLPLPSPCCQSAAQTFLLYFSFYTQHSTPRGYRVFERGYFTATRHVNPLLTYLLISGSRGRGACRDVAYIAGSVSITAPTPRPGRPTPVDIIHYTWREVPGLSLGLAPRVVSGGGGGGCSGRLTSLIGRDAGDMTTRRE